MARISLDLSSTLTCPNTLGWQDAPGAHHINRRLTDTFVMRTPQHLPVYRNHLTTDQRTGSADPAYEAGLELLRV